MGSQRWTFRYYFKRNIQIILGTWINEPRISGATKLLPLVDVYDLVNERSYGSPPDKTTKILLAILGCRRGLGDVAFLSTTNGRRVKAVGARRCGKKRGCIDCAGIESQALYGVLVSAFQKLAEQEGLGGWLLAMMTQTCPHPKINWLAPNEVDLKQSLLLMSEAARRFEMDHSELIQNLAGATERVRVFEERFRMAPGSYHAHFHSAIFCNADVFCGACLTDEASGIARDAQLRLASYKASSLLNEAWNKSVRTTVRYMRKRQHNFAHWINLEADWIVARTHLSRDGKIKGGLVFEYTRLRDYSDLKDVTKRICSYLSKEISFPNEKLKSEKSKDPLSLLLVSPDKLTSETINAFLWHLTRKRTARITFTRKRSAGKSRSFYKDLLGIERLDDYAPGDGSDNSRLSFVLKNKDYQELTADGRLANYVSDYESGGESLEQRDERIRSVSEKELVAFRRAESLRTREMIMVSAHRLKDLPAYVYLAQLGGKLRKRFDRMDPDMRLKLIVDSLHAAKRDYNVFYTRKYQKMLEEHFRSAATNASASNKDEAI